MSDFNNWHEAEPPRYYVTESKPGWYVIRDSERNDNVVGTELATEADAIEHCKALNAK